jgi:hypothetical protein
MLGVDPQSMAWAFPFIAAGSAALLVVVVAALAFRFSDKSGVARARWRNVLVLAAALLSASLTWTFLDNATVRGQNAERNALKLRAGQLTAQSLAPGSPLPCLDTLAGDSVQAACERAVFASPESVATAISYVAAQLSLLADMSAYAEQGGTHINDALVPLRSALEADPFGFLAYVLVVRNGCTSEHCAPFALLRNSSHVRTNIIAQTLSHYLDHYREVWARSAEEPVLGAAGTLPPGMAENDPAKRKVSVDIDFPSAASIPPISIMNPEPKTPVSPDPAHKRESAAQTDPVWTPAPAAPGK